MKSLRESLRNYLSLRRGLGFKLVEAGRGLVSFVSFLESRESTHVTTALALEWAQQPKDAQPSHWSRRLTWVRSFAQYLSTKDLRTEIPPIDLLPHKTKRARPYLYTDDEIEQLLKAALNMSPRYSLQPWTFYCLLGLLSVSGLRVGEILRLELRDLDLKEGILTVRESKGKSRLVPLHATTQQVLVEYIARRNRFLNGMTFPQLFISSTGNKLDGGELRRTFYRLSRRTGLRGKNSRSGPRLHDFRHNHESRIITSKAF